MGGGGSVDEMDRFLGSGDGGDDYCDCADKDAQPGSASFGNEQIIAVFL